MAQTQKEKWREFMEMVIDAIDVREVCESWGIEFTGSVSPGGWAECRAKGREDRKPSAAVNLATGYYRDLGPGPSYPFFRLGVEMGPYATFHDCLRDLAKKAKLLSRMPKSRAGQSFWSALKWKKWNSLACRGLCEELGVSEETLKLCGGSMAISNAGEMVVAFPVYDCSRGFEASQRGAVAINAGGGKLTHYRGKGAPPEMIRTKCFGDAGIVNRNAIQNWQNAAVIYKVEGITDMIALQGLIPEDLRSTHLVVTNSDGADSFHTPHGFADMARGKNIVIIHDADEPGQFGSSQSRTGGAARWEAACLRGGAETVVNVQLPYEIQKKKGKDLRDWIDEGHDYSDLVELVKKTPVSKASKAIEEEAEKGLLPHQIILKALDLVVLGHTKSGAIQVFNAATCRKFTIPDIDRFSYAKQLIHIGKAAHERIADPSDQMAESDMIDSSDVRVAIAREAGAKELSRTNTVGVGIWESGGRLFAVGAGEWIAANGGVDVYRSPTVDDKIVDFGEEEEAWYDTDLLYSYLESSKSIDWRVQHFEELAEIFDRWKNHTHPMAGSVMACLAIATWGQTVWTWRPWIAITGQSSAGKTILMEFLANYFGNLCVATSNASEAGIRNTIGTSSRILMLDEFESSPHRSAILEMLMSSNRRGRFGKSLRSNASQGSVTSEYQLMPWFSATEMKKDKQTEVNRYITFELGSREGLEYFDIPSEEDFLSPLRNRSIAVVMRIWKRVREINEYILESMSSEYFRQSESYALVSSVFSAIHGYSNERGVGFHSGMIESLQSEVVIEPEEKEHDMILNAILSSTIQVGGGKSMTVARLLSEERQEGWDADPEEILRTYGIRRVSYSEVVGLADYQRERRARHVPEGSFVFFDTSKGGMIRRKLLKGTDHDRMDLRTVLSRIEGSFRGLLRVNAPTRGVFVPSSVVGSVDSMKFADGNVDEDLVFV